MPQISPITNLDPAQLNPFYILAHTCVLQVVLVALPGLDLEAVQEEVNRQCDALPRGDIARQALSHSCVVRVDSKVPIITNLCPHFDQEVRVCGRHVAAGAVP